MKKNIYIVLGLGFGDEGKGLGTDFLSLQNPNSLVIRFNGVGSKQGIPFGKAMANTTFSLISEQVL